MARGWRHTKLSIKCLSSVSIFFWHMLCVIVSLFLSFLFCFVLVFMLSLELCRCPSDLFMSSRTHVPDWQPCILLGMVKARLVNGKNIHTHNDIIISSALQARCFIDFLFLRLTKTQSVFTCIYCGTRLNGLTWSGTVESVSRDRILGREGGQEEADFLVELTTSRIGNHTG